jgi:hypothetical protein
MSNESSVPPIRRALSVSWNHEDAYRRFVDDFGAWWPRRTCSIGGRRIKRVVFEAKVGGAIYEEHHDGTRFQWGRVTALESPRRVAFTFHSSREESDAQQIEVRFVPDATGTRVELVSSGWEKLEGDARRAYGGYRMSWTLVLGTYGNRFTPSMLFFGAMAVVMDTTGLRSSFVKNSRGRMPPASTA